MPNHATPIIYWASGRPLGYLFSWGKFSFLIFWAWQEPCWAHKEAHQLLAQCLDKGITPAGAGELQSCLIYIVIYSAGIPVLPEYKLAFQHVYSHTPTVSSAVTGNCTQKQQSLAWCTRMLVNQQWGHPLLWRTKESDSPASIFFRFWGLVFCSNCCSCQVSFPGRHHSQGNLGTTRLFAHHPPRDVEVTGSMVCDKGTMHWPSVTIGSLTSSDLLVPLERAAQGRSVCQNHVQQCRAWWVYTSRCMAGGHM